MKSKQWNAMSIQGRGKFLDKVYGSFSAWFHEITPLSWEQIPSLTQEGINEKEKVCDRSMITCCSAEVANQDEMVKFCKEHCQITCGCHSLELHNQEEKQNESHD